MSARTGIDHIDAFFARYEEGANTFDADILAAEYAERFMLAGPDAVAVRENDAGWRDEAAPARAAFAAMGFERARIVALTARPLGEAFWLAEARWAMRFAPPHRDPVETEFDYTYVLRTDPDLRLVFTLSHASEAATVSELGLLPPA